MYNPLKTFWVNHPKLRKALSLGQAAKNARAKAASVLSYLIIHAGITVPATMMVAVGVSLPLLYAKGWEAGVTRCQLGK